MNVLFALGRPLGPLYGAAMKARERLYLKGILTSHKLSVPVISIGNLVLGGTGKTPTVKHVTKLLSKAGFKPAIISRGYGGTANKNVNIVSDGNNILLSPEAAGDEPYMLAQTFPKIPVVTGAKRINPCNYAVERFDIDVVILDDGFQHMAVTRDINLVLFDATILAGNSRIFPGGPLREPVSALTRCDSFIITGRQEKNSNRASQFGDLLQTKYPGKPIFYASYGPEKIINHRGDEIDKPVGKNFFAFCGIAHPERFINCLHSIDIEIIGSLILKDHANYSPLVISKLHSLARANNADAFFTTSKDYVKLSQYRFDLPIHILDPGYSMEEEFNTFLLEKLGHIKEEISSVKESQRTGRK